MLHNKRLALAILAVSLSAAAQAGQVPGAADAPIFRSVHATRFIYPIRLPIRCP